MEEEAREIPTMALRGKGAAEGNLAESIRRRFAALGGVEFTELPREPMRRPPQLGR
jgi:hypothetical protein